MLNFKSSLRLEAEAKVVKGGRERIYSFNYRDSLNKKKKEIFITVVLLQFQHGKGDSLLSVRDRFFRALTANFICPLGYVTAQNVLVFFCWRDCALCNSFCSDSSSQHLGSSNSGRKANFHLKEKEISITKNLREPSSAFRTVLKYFGVVAEFLLDEGGHISHVP